MMANDNPQIVGFGTQETEDGLICLLMNLHIADDAGRAKIVDIEPVEIPPEENIQEWVFRTYREDGFCFLKKEGEEEPRRIGRYERSEIFTEDILEEDGETRKLREKEKEEKRKDKERLEAIERVFERLRDDM